MRTLGIGISIDLPVFDRNQGQIAEAAATRQELFDEYIARVSDAQHEVVSAIDDIAALNNQIAAAESAMRTLEGSLAVFRSSPAQGNADVLSVYAPCLILSSATRS